MDRTTTLPIVTVAVLILALGVLQTGFLKGGLGGVTTYLGEKSRTTDVVNAAITIIREAGAVATDALFDITLKIPDKYVEIEKGEELLAIVDLANYGTEENTNLELSYIITDAKGNIVYIEHEERVVPLRTSFLKRLRTQDLNYGKYKLFVEMLYSDTSAMTAAAFEVVYDKG